MKSYSPMSNQIFGRNACLSVCYVLPYKMSAGGIKQDVERTPKCTHHIHLNFNKARPSTQGQISYGLVMMMAMFVVVMMVIIEQ